MYLGIDIGFSSSKAVVIDSNKQIKAISVVNAANCSKNLEAVVNQVLMQANIRRNDIKKCAVTGQGRMIYNSADVQITEITCHAIGVHHLNPEVRTIIDVGGQDAKVIKLSSIGLVENFVINEEYVTGIGCFLESIADELNLKLNQLSKLGENATKTVALKCDSLGNIVQLLSDNKVEDLVLGAHKLIADRIVGLCNKIKLKPLVAITGGVAMNNNIVDCIESKLGEKIIRLENPQSIGALGAALYALNMDK